MSLFSKDLDPDLNSQKIAVSESPDADPKYWSKMIIKIMLNI